jgi:hypothetical protein
MAVPKLLSMLVSFVDAVLAIDLKRRSHQSVTGIFTDRVEKMSKDNLRVTLNRVCHGVRFDGLGLNLGGLLSLLTGPLPD